MTSDVRIHVGCQGWNYSDWVTKALGDPVFYPRGTKSPDTLSVYSNAFETVEVDSTFYAIPSSSAVEGWYKKTPETFTFALKLPREITHERHLQEDAAPVLHAFCQRAVELNEKLAAVLIQLPPSFDATKENALRLRKFLALLPRGMHFSFEFRHRDWLVQWTYDELARHGASLCIVEGSWIPRDTMFEAIGKNESSVTYVRFMGERDLEKFDRVHRARDGNLALWAEEIRKIRSPRVFVYFSNFYEGLATVSANKLREKLGQETVGPELLETQKTLFES